MFFNVEIILTSYSLLHGLLLFDMGFIVDLYLSVHISFMKVIGLIATHKK